MNCPKCGNINDPSYKFCIKCGQNLSEIQPNVEQQNVGETPAQPVVEQEVNAQINQPESVQVATPIENTNTVENKGPAITKSIADYFFIILAVILKPFTAFKEELNKFNEFTNSAILSLIVSGSATIINLFTTMLSVVRVKTFSWSDGYTTTWVWENLKRLNYLEVIGKNFLIYLGVIVVIAAVYYIASLIVKKQTNFARLLGISALVVVPMLVCSLVLSPLLALIWSDLAIPVVLVGGIYTILLLYEGINNELLLEGNAKYYFNLVCFSILGIAVYYLSMKLIMGSISGGLDDMMNLFG